MRGPLTDLVVLSAELSLASCLAQHIVVPRRYARTHSAAFAFERTRPKVRARFGFARLGWTSRESCPPGSHKSAFEFDYVWSEFGHISADFGRCRKFSGQIWRMCPGLG